MKKRVVLVGMPNTGKSTLFNRLTGSMAKTGNWPGITVDLLRARLMVGPDLVELVDLPGIYDLRGYSDDEKVVQTFLTTQDVHALILVVNASQLLRQLRLVLQVQHLGIPVLLVLNMHDEAQQRGIHVDLDGLAAYLEIPVLALSAKKGTGLNQIEPTLASILSGLTPKAVHQGFFAHLPSEEALTLELSVLDRYIQVPRQADADLTERLDRLFLHPWLGLPLFLLMLYLMFQGVYALGTPIQDVLASSMDLVKSQILQPLFHFWPATWSGSGFVQGLLLDGVWDGLATVASFVPLIILFFLFMALLEDTGYFSRAAFLLDALMQRLGLDGRAFVMVLMGFGCNVPALMGTRVMRSRAMRLLTMLIIPMSLCSARLQVFVFIASVLFGPHQAPLVLFGLYLTSIASAMLTALLFRRFYASSEPFILEMPPYRLPTMRMMVLRAWHEVGHFLRRATRFITLGVVMVWLMTHLPWGAGEHASWAAWVGHWTQSIMQPIGLDDNLTLTLIFGFVAKEIVLGSLAVIYHLQGHGLEQHLRHSLTLAQGLSFMVFTLVYTPCLSTVVTLYHESRSRFYTLLAVAWPLLLAWVLAYLTYQEALRW